MPSASQCDVGENGTSGESSDFIGANTDQRFRVLSNYLRHLFFLRFNAY